MVDPTERSGGRVEGSGMDRRRFLRLGAGALGALAAPALLQACARNGNPSATPTPTGDSNVPPQVQALVDQRMAAGAQGGLEVHRAGEAYLSGIPSYIPFGLAAGTSVVTGTEATLWMVPDLGDDTPRLGPLAAPYLGFAHPDGPPPVPQGVNAVELTFPTPGIWYAVAEATVGGKKLVGGAAYQVFPKEASRSPYPGQPAPATATPTVTDPKGINPICTRTPACDMHEVSLPAALGSGKPVLLAIGTPAFCASKVCGPNIEELLAVKQEFGSRAVFVHAEVYVDDTQETINARKVTPAMKDYGLRSEPWLFMIDRNGTLAYRFEGPVTAPTIKTTLAKLV
ncbi:MAG: TlpA family protein disulfide reductase [Actinomycetota bacterium]